MNEVDALMGPALTALAPIAQKYPDMVKEVSAVIVKTLAFVRESGEPASPAIWARAFEMAVNEEGSEMLADEWFSMLPV